MEKKHSSCETWEGRVRRFSYCAEPGETVVISAVRVSAGGRPPAELDQMLKTSRAQRAHFKIGSMKVMIVET